MGIPYVGHIDSDTVQEDDILMKVGKQIILSKSKKQPVVLIGKDA